MATVHDSGRRLVSGLARVSSLRLLDLNNQRIKRLVSEEALVGTRGRRVAAVLHACLPWTFGGTEAGESNSPRMSGLLLL